MKRIFVSSILCICLFACKNNESSSKNGTSSSLEETTDEKADSDKKVSKRDISINASNSYTDLFLDSAALESFLTTEKLDPDVERRVRSFYNARNYQFAWFASDGLTEQARAFWNLHNYYTTYSKDSALSDKALKRKVDALASAEELKVNSTDKSFINTEFKLTQHFIQYALKNYEAGTVKRKEMERFVPRKKEDPIRVADSLLTKKHKDNKYFEDGNQPYKLLKAQLQKYVDIAKKGGWQTITAADKKIKKGAASPAVLSIKKRLEATGEMPAGDTTNVFNDQLESAVKTFQVSRGLTADGVVTASLIKEMNVPVNKRIEQILINMDRMRWMPQQLEKGNMIMVNIPEFILHVYEGKSKAFDMRVVVGKEGHNTMMFTGNLNQVVFSPYWNITPDITKKEIMPAMAKNPHYLERNNMEIVSNEGGTPVIRQLPGPKNSLGKVKFLFPNDFNIYFHDTPAKNLFSLDKRAYSHGCIRLSDPVKMANYILRDNAEWTPEKIDEAMNAGVEKFVKVKDPIPVLISYYTAWVDENGVLNFRDDIYKHDSNLVSKMFIGS